MLYFYCNFLLNIPFLRGRYGVKKKILGIAASILATSLIASSAFASDEGLQPMAPDNPYGKMDWTWVTKGKTISSPYGWRKLNGVKEFHKGVDVDVSFQPIYASQAGSIMSSGEFKDGAKYIALKTNDKDPNNKKNLVARYLHLSKIKTEKGSVTKGQEIGTSGDSGKVKAHLHFDVNNANTYSGSKMDESNTINPKLFYPSIISKVNSLNEYSEQDAIEIFEHEISDNDQENYFDNALIYFVGKDEFHKWSQSLPEESRKLSTFKKHFNISDELEQKLKEDFYKN